MNKLWLYFIFWLVGWGKIIDGLTHVLSFGLWHTHFTLDMSKKYAKYYHIVQSRKEKNNE